MTLNVGDVAKGIPMGNATTGGGGGGVSPAEIEELKQEVTTLGQNVTQIGQDVAQVDEEIVSLSSSIDNKQDLLSVNNPLSFTNDYLVVIKDGGVTGNLTSEQTDQMGGVETTGGSYWSITALTFNDAVPEQYYMRKYDPLNPEVVWNRSSNQAEFFWVFVNVTGNKVTPKLIVQGNGGNIGPKTLQLDSSTASQSLKKYTVSASNTQRYSKEYYKVQDNGNDTYSILYEDGVTLDVPNLKPSVDKINAVYKYLYPSSVFTGGDINAYTFYDTLESTRQIVYRPKDGDILNTAVGKTLSVENGEVLEKIVSKEPIWAFEDLDESMTGYKGTSGVLVPSLDYKGTPTAKFKCSVVKMENGIIADSYEQEYPLANGLSYSTPTQAIYDALVTPDPNTLYRTSDTNNVYLGSIKLNVSA